MSRLENTSIFLKGEIDLMLTALFWTFIALVLYVYIGYPLLIAVMARIWPRAVLQPVGHDASDLPMVTVIIPAHNEEQWIERKIENTLALDYPPDRMHILVASDGSTDKTVELAKQFASRGVDVIHYSERAGKVATMNRTVPCAEGEIIFFTDANALLEADALRLLIQHFSDPQVGCAGGNRVCIATNTLSTKGESLYWRYEAWIRHSESCFRSGLGVYGQLFAVRRQLFPVMSVVSDDFPIPMKILLTTGARTVFEPRAMARIPAARTMRQEWERKIRSHVAFLCDIPNLKKGLVPWRSSIWWQFWSHHVFRVIVPFAMIAALVTSPLLWKAGMVYQIALSGQLLFYSLAVAGFLFLSKGIRLRVPYVCFYFVFANLALVLAWARWLRGGRYHTWRRTERILPAVGSQRRESTWD
jgi:biofilm PGA synthesis N-glycosyltransferase PgaC